MGRPLSRRTLLVATLAAAAAAAAAPAAHAALDAGAWSGYRDRFVQSDGRVVDDGNGGVSHSEGQGFGLLLAVAAGDRARFDAIWRWTDRNLRVRDDALSAWRWLPDSPRERTPDRNNATDGDILIAWALMRAGARWGEASYVAAARAIARDVRDRVTRPVGDRLVLLPGAAGFVDGERVTLNPSYWIFPALAALNAIDPDPAWGALTASGLHFLRSVRIGATGLPPDWFDLVGDRAGPSRHAPPRFGYDAVRVPLYLAWAGLDHTPAAAAARAHWAAAGAAPPAWIDLADGSRSPEDAPAGFRAVAALLDRPRDGRAAFPAAAADEPYYSASLGLLARVAWREANGW